MAGTILLGLTGGIGSGKSTVAQRLAARGAVVIDADAISRNLTAAGGQAMAAIAAEFGQEFMTPDGALDRARMRELAYRDGNAKRRLEAIIHPMVSQETQRQTLEAMAQDKPCVVFDIPLLVEAGHWRPKLHRILVIDCAEETQIERVMARNGLSRDAVEKIIAAQAPRKLRLAAADVVVYNQSLSLGDLYAEVDQFAGCFGL